MRTRSKGFSLMELAIAVGLIAMLMGVVAAGGGMMSKCRIQREAQAVDSLRVASQNFITGANLTYTGISVSVLKTGGFLPGSFDATKSNSFGGDYTVSVNKLDNAKVDIALANVPQNAGLELSGIFNAKADGTNYDAASKIWLATF